MMDELSLAAILTAFLAGGISFLSPCVLPLVPGYVAFIAGHSIERAPRGGRQTALRPLPPAFVFVLGFSTIFVLLGASASLLGQWLLSYRYEATLVGGAITTLFGLFTTGLLRMPVLERDFRYHGSARPSGLLSAYLLGVAFGFGWTPCIGPVLGSILMITTVTANAHGMALLATYSLGLGVPFIAAALLTEQFATYARRLGRFGRVLQVMAGSVMMAVGIAIMTGHLTDLALWILETFPSLARIG